MKNTSTGVLIFSLLLSGCGTVQQWVAFYNPLLQRTPDYQHMTYLEIINLDIQQKYMKHSHKRMVMFYSKLKVNEQEAGVKFVFPF